ncbi:MAG: aspartate-semialdehyde dehydrogenase [Eubacteriales bacterium]|nr:aspartate-semialdehyde dehydrogenase [Eubacteriales bacterium]MDD4106046.1 aspartate-semialdehyde dehydrogenase [Eubacteriales bacterium]MDD4711367.1 aspartate-semialdehyde dehydrogenase [Eubacteriales bacterium]NLO14958.1 aspartate-semialdehyde dehydrogenase [Clostridiales bacterium]
MKKWRVGIVGATGMVGQRLVSLLHDHEWFSLELLAASSRSAGKTYEEALKGRWSMPTKLPDNIRHMRVLDAQDINTIKSKVDFVFCAVALSKLETRAMEERFAKNEIPVISNNSACRMLPDVPMVIPEINSAHFEVITGQKKRLGTRIGFIAVKPNCSIQSYVPALTPLRAFGIKEISVCTYQAVSGAGKTLETWPEMADNVIPYIGGEEEKSEQEPLKVWGSLSYGSDAILPAPSIKISAQCLRVPVSDGHMAAVSVSFENKPSMQEMIAIWGSSKTEPQSLHLPSAPNPYLKYFDEDDRPQTRLDRDLSEGMGISIGRLRDDSIFDYRFVCLSHNTLRGAAGGGVLTAEMLCSKGYIPKGEDQ